MEIEIQCPAHNEIETIELPDSYRDFEGDISCATRLPSDNRGATLRIKIVDGKLISLVRSS